MALYSAIGSQFKASLMKEFDSLLDERIKSVITQTLKQVAHDYDLDYKALKNRYCSKESLVEYVTVDLNEARQEARHEVETQIVDHDEYAFEPEPEPVVKPKAKVTASKPKPAMALSKMKKAELVEECEVRGLDSEGTVSQLRERLKNSRDPEPAKKKASPKKKVAEGDPDPVKKKASPKKKKVEGDPDKKKPVKKKKEEPAPVPHAVVALEEEDEDDDGVHVKPALEDEDDEDVCRRVPVDGDGDEFEVEDDDSGFEKKLRAILLEAGELEEEEDELPPPFASATTASDSKTTTVRPRRRMARTRSICATGLRPSFTNDLFSSPIVTGASKARISLPLTLE